MKRKIVIFLTIIFGLFTAGIALTFLFITDVTGDLNRIIKLHQIEQFRRTLWINIQSVQGDLYKIKPSHTQSIDAIVSNMESLENASGRCTSCHHSTGIHTRIMKIQELIKDYNDHLSFYITMSANEMRVIKLKIESSEIGESILKEIQDMSYLGSKNLDMTTEKTSINFQIIIKILLVTLMGTLIIATFFAVRLTTSIINPINTLLDATRTISSGRLGCTVDHNFKTEFGELADNFNIMSLGLKKNYDDITREIAEHKETGRKLRESEERYALAARAANDGLWDWNLKTNMIYYSPRWKSILGFSEDEIGDSPEEWLKRIHPDDIFLMEKEISSWKESGSEQFQKEYRIIHKDGLYRWVLTRGIAVSDETNAPCRMIGSQSDITERKKADDRLIYDAFHDLLTNLPNRALFFNYLEMAAKKISREGSSKMLAVLFLDIDRFKVINDTIGHMAGDKLLVSVSRRLKESLRPGDMVARFGGDEFAVILEDISGYDDVINLLDRIREKLSFPYFIDDDIKENKIFNSVSIGVCFSDCGFAKPEELLRNADIAMYHAKSAGKDCYKIFSSDMYQHVITSMQLERDIKNALENREFVIHYQPVISVKTGSIIGFEALVRWQHQVHGLMMPGEFIHIAEETGLIIELGKWVLVEACWQIKTWQDKYPGTEELTMSVNISGKQCNEDLVDLVKKTLKETGINPRTLKLEITETILMQNADHIEPLLGNLKRLNVELQIDDFGTGYSSLSYLHNYPIDALKIDKEFISQMNHKRDEKIAIVNAIASLAKNLNMYVIAEGVENEEQAVKLCSLYCDHMQGFLISKPLTLQEVENFLAENRLFLFLKTPA